MIKKLIGIIVAVAVIVIIVVAAVRRDQFPVDGVARRDVERCPADGGAFPPDSAAEFDVPAELPAESDVPAEPVPDAGAVDSLTVEVTDSI